MRTITLAVANRPELLERLFTSLKLLVIEPDVDIQMFIRAEPMGTPESDRVIQLCEEFIEDFSFPVDFKVNEKVLGIVENTYGLMELAFDNHKSESNLYLEDDFVLSPDTLQLWSWYVKQDLRDIGALCLFNRWGDGDPNTVHKSRAMMCWGFIMTQVQWKKYAKPSWRNPEMMWDSSLANYIRTFPGTYNLFPNLSRSTNTGKVGVHVNPGIWEQIVGGHVWNNSFGPFKYKLIDEIKPNEAA